MIQLTLTILLQAAAMTAGGADYAMAYQEATQGGRPMVVLVGAEWCPACRQMKLTTIPELEKKGDLGKFAFVYVNSDEQSELAGKLMQGSTIPQLILYHKTDAGWKRQQLTGIHAVSDVQAFLSQAKEAPAPKLSRRD